MDRYGRESKTGTYVVNPELTGSLPDTQFGERLGQALLRSLTLKATTPIRSAGTESGAFPDSMLSDVPPVVPDTNILRHDLTYACSKSVRTVLVNAANAQFLRLYCAPHVIEEISEHGQEWASQAGVPYDVFMRRWEAEYLPLIRVVPVGVADERLLTQAERQRIDVLRREDNDDVPSSVLALVLSAYYLTKDRAALKAVYGDAADLIKHDHWLEILKAGGNAGELGLMLNGLISVVGLAGYGVVAGVRRLPPIVAVPGLALLGGLAFISYRRSTHDARQSLRAGLGRFAIGVVELFAAYQAYLTEFRNAAPSSPDWVTLASASSRDAALERACLYALCRSRTSHRSAFELSTVLPNIAVGHSEAKVRATLRTSALIFETWRGRWQVGCRSTPMPTH